MNKYKNKTLHRLIPKATALTLRFINVKGIVHPKIKILSQCFIFIPPFTHSKVVLNLNEFLSSAEHKCYFEECGKPNSCWSTVTFIVFSFPTIKFSVDQHLSGYPDSSKYLLLSSAQERN